MEKEDVVIVAFDDDENDDVDDDSSKDQDFQISHLTQKYFNFCEGDRS